MSLLLLTLWEVRGETLLELYRFLCSQETHISPHTSHLTGKTWARKEKEEYYFSQLRAPSPSSLFFVSSFLISESLRRSKLRVLSISDIIIPHRYQQLCQCSGWRCLQLFSRETFLFINTWNYKNYKRLQSLQYTIYNEGNKTFKCSSSESLFYILQVVHA